MDRRGRSRDVSPIALARRKLQADHYNTPLVVPPLTPSNLARPSSPHEHLTTANKSRSATPTTRNTPTSPPPPIASTSTPPPSPPSSPTSPFMRTLSTSTLSLSPDPSASGPLTPPEYPYSGTDHRALEYYDSPPSPPRTLQDRMQVAYALDDMHLAKVLLLKLQGIEVTSDDDPRIALVKDADFNDAFVPPGGLVLEEEVENRCREAERREQDRRRRRARDERLKACEKIWENSVRSLREDKERVARRKDDRLREKRRSQMQAREREREVKERERQAERAQDPFTRHTRQLRVPPFPSQRAVLSYGALPASSSRMGSEPALPPLSKSPPRHQQTVDTSFQYAIMQPTHSPPSSVRHMSSSPMSPLRAYNEFAVQSRNVTFSDVIKSMRGPLFSVAMEEEERSSRGRNGTQVKLFDELLRPERWDGDESRSPIRTKDRIPRRRTTDECVACSLDSEASSSSLSGSSSSQTAVSLAESARTETTVRSPSPSTHANVSWFPFRMRTLLLAQVKEVDDVQSPLPLESGSMFVVKHSCPHSLRVVVDFHPLGSALSVPKSPSPAAVPSLLRRRARPSPSSRSSSVARSATSPSTSLMKRVTRSVSTFLDMATSFQRAYVNATMSNTGASWDDDSGDGRSRSRSSSRGCGSRSVSVVGGGNSEWSVTMEGYRASSADVAVFTSTSIPTASLSAVSSPTSSSSPDTTTQAQIQLTHPLIPLYPLTPPSSTSPSIPRKLPPPTQPPRSPFRLPYPPPTVTSRLRPIANPLLLRMRAAQNACVEPDVRGRLANEIREVKEKMVGVAWEGIGRSGLGWEVQVRVC